MARADAGLPRKSSLSALRFFFLRSSSFAALNKLEPFHAAFERRAGRAEERRRHSSRGRRSLTGRSPRDADDPGDFAMREARLKFQARVTRANQADAERDDAPGSSCPAAVCGSFAGRIAGLVGALEWASREKRDTPGRGHKSSGYAKRTASPPIQMLSERL